MFYTLLEEMVQNLDVFLSWPRLVHGDGNGRQDNNKKSAKIEQEDNNLNYPETQSTRMPKTGVEPEWFNNDQSSTYIGFMGSRMIATLAIMCESYEL